MKKFALFLLIVVSIWSLTTISCVHEPIIGPSSGDTIKTDTIKPQDTIKQVDTVKPVTKLCDTTKIFFNRDILPIFVQNCAIVGCHDARTGSDGYVLTSYTTITKKGISSGKPNNSTIYQVITSNNARNIMPPPPSAPLSKKQIELINKWITEGIKNDTCTDIIPCDTSNVSYSKHIQPIWDKYCISCHGKSLDYSGVRLHTYANAKAALEAGRLMGSLRWTTGFTNMPLDQPKLSACDLEKIEIWVRKGAPNN